jgi:hypothetical protein
MNTKKITHYNKVALQKADIYIKLSDQDNAPVQKRITFFNHSDLHCNILSILSAIEFMGLNGNKDDLITCGCLANLAQKLLPSDEMEFLDGLIIRDSSNKNDFVTIESNKNESNIQ